MEDEMPVTEQVKKNKVTMCKTNDIELVKRFRNGDENAFGIMLKCYQPQLMRAATVLLLSEQDAMDIVQDVFVKVYFKLQSFREDASLCTWLYRILYNCTRHYIYV